MLSLRVFSQSLMASGQSIEQPKMSSYLYRLSQYGEALRIWGLGHNPSPKGFRSPQTLRKAAARVD